MQSSYLVSVEIPVDYKPGMVMTNHTAKMSIYNATGSLVSAVSGDMSEFVSASGVYRKSFTPDTIGTWTVFCYAEHNSNHSKTALVVRDFSVGSHNVSTAGTAAQSGLAQATINTGYLNEVRSVLSAHTGVIGNIDTQLDAVEAKIDALSAGAYDVPMIG